MKILYNEELKKHTTFKCGGTAKEFLIPESVEELIQVIKERSPKHIIGGGSNLLIADREFDLVVSMESVSAETVDLGGGRFKAGASVRLQTLINTVNEAGYGGMEYLYSVPGLVGGAVVMNAGRGRGHNKSIADYIETVTTVSDGEIREWTQAECGFDYRSSVFKNSGHVIISVLLKFPAMSTEQSSAAKAERLELCKKNQDNSFPNSGSVFLECDAKVMSYLRKHEVGCGKVHFSGKTPNWLLNEGGSFEDAKCAIEKAEFYHRKRRKECKLEIIIWE